MPLYQNRTFMERIYTGGVEIKRVYRGKDLVWGIYELIYHDRTEDTSDYWPGRYVWGIRYDLMSDLDDYFEEYKTHYDGWYEDSSFIVAIPYVTKDLHKDLELYAKWRQRKFSYSGVVRYWTWVGGGGGGGIDDLAEIAQQYNGMNKSEVNSASKSGYQLTTSNWCADFTWLCLSETDFGHTKDQNYDWATAKWPYTADNTLGWDDVEEVSSPQKNDLVVFRTNAWFSHIGIMTSSTNCISGNWANLVQERTVAQMVAYEGYTAVQYYRLSGEGGGGGGGSWDDEPWPVSETECSDQNNPELPNANDIKRGDVSPSGEYRDSFWDTEERFTYERSFDYSTINWGNWSLIDYSKWNFNWDDDPLKIDWDYVQQTDANEIDFLYTTDTHLCWNGSGTSQYAESPVFKLTDVGYYNDKLWNAGIPTFCLDCGDWVHGTGGETQINQIINMFNNCGSKGLKKYLAVTHGNHEWYSVMGNASQCLSYLDRVNNFTCCNLEVNNELRYKPYRAIRIGQKKIGIIAVGYPSPNGRGSNTAGDVHEFENCKFLDAKRNDGLQPESALYKRVQTYINLFKANNFDYIIAITHMDKYDDEDFDDDGRFNSRADFLIRNTKGLDVVIPGHWNYQIDQVYSFNGLDGKKGIIVQEAGASFHNIGRLRFKFNDSNKIQSYLLKTRNDLEVVS